MMFPQFEAFEIIYNALDAIEQKIMKKFYKSMDELIGFIGEYCNEESMGKFKRQVKKMLNKPIDDLPDKNELRELFTNKKTKEPDHKLVKGFLSALKTITDRRRLRMNSIKQSKLLAEADYEAQLLRLIEIVDVDIKSLDAREKILNEVGGDQVATLIEQLKAADNGRLKLDEIKPLWMSNGQIDTLGLADFTNQVIEKIEAAGGTLQEEEDVQPKRAPDAPSPLIERPTSTDVLEQAEENPNATAEMKQSEEIADSTDKEIVKEAAAADALDEDAVKEEAAAAKVQENEPVKDDAPEEFEEP